MKEMPPLPRRRFRRLSDEEIELWLTVTRTVAPRPGAKAPARAPQAAGEEEPRPSPAEVPKAPIAAKPNAPMRPVLPQLAELDRRQRQKVSRGQVPVDDVLDLHGLRQQEAHTSLHRFLLRAQREGAKLVLIVTGKGEGQDEGFFAGGVLRRSVPLWLRAPEWRSLVVGFEEASRRHGGSGALYVRLRRHDRSLGERRGGGA
jgi:DNA-nicking Smr family endonuclease